MKIHTTIRPRSFVSLSFASSVVGLFCAEFNRPRPRLDLIGKKKKIIKLIYILK